MQLKLRLKLQLKLLAGLLAPYAARWAQRLWVACSPTTHFADVYHAYL